MNAAVSLLQTQASAIPITVNEMISTPNMNDTSCHGVRGGPQLRPLQVQSMESVEHVYDYNNYNVQILLVKILFGNSFNNLSRLTTGMMKSRAASQNVGNIIWLCNILYQFFLVQ